MVGVHMYSANNRDWTSLKSLLVFVLLMVRKDMHVNEHKGLSKINVDTN
jgi:hypothetical protein